jgi:hypothetical protein
VGGNEQQLRSSVVQSLSLVHWQISRELTPNLHVRYDALEVKGTVDATISIRRFSNTACGFKNDLSGGGQTRKSALREEIQVRGWKTEVPVQRNPHDNK